MSRWQSPAGPLTDWGALAAIVDGRTRFLLTTHVNPDGDGLGCEVAMALYLRARGKDVTVLNEGQIPHNFEFLAASFPIASFEPARARALVDAAEVLWVLDTGARSRLGALGAFVERPGLEVVILDHHATPPDFGTLRLSVPEACATGELVYDFLRRHDVRWTVPIAEALYTALATDTGSFRFSNTDPPAHAMAAHLLELGVRPEPLLAKVNMHRHADRLRFVGEVLRQVALTADGRIAWLEVDRDTMERFRVDGGDTEGLVDFPRSLPGVEAVVLFTEQTGGSVKVSMRSTGRADVNRVAGMFGGGGHRAAAGATVAGPLPDAREQVLLRLRDEVARAAGGDGGAA